MAKQTKRNLKKGDIIFLLVDGSPMARHEIITVTSSMAYSEQKKFHLPVQNDGSVAPVVEGVALSKKSYWGYHVANEKLTYIWNRNQMLIEIKEAINGGGLSFQELKQINNIIKTSKNAKR